MLDIVELPCKGRALEEANAVACFRGLEIGPQEAGVAVVGRGAEVNSLAVDVGDERSENSYGWESLSEAGMRKVCAGLVGSQTHP